MRSLPAIRRMSSIPMSASTAALARMAALPALSRQNKSCTKGKRRAKRRLFPLSSRKSRHAIFAGEETPSSHASASHLRGSPIYSFSLAALDSFSRGRARAAPLPTHLLRICAGALKCPEQLGISKFASGQSPTSSRQGVVVCGALRLPHDLICLPLLFPQNSLRDFCGNPERQESARSPLTREG